MTLGSGACYGSIAIADGYEFDGFSPLDWGSFDGGAATTTVSGSCSTRALGETPFVGIPASLAGPSEGVPLGSFVPPGFSESGL